MRIIFFIFATLWYGPILLAATQSDRWQVSRFHIQIQRSPGGEFGIKVTHSQNPQHTLWASRSNKGFLSAAIGRERVKYERASFKFNDRIQKRCQTPIIDNIVPATADALSIHGSFKDCADLNFTMQWRAKSANQLGFKISLQGNPEFNRIQLNYDSNPDELFYGFGAQYFSYNVKGRKLPIWVEEQGVGRGKQPLSLAMQLVGAGSSVGNWHTTSSYVPYYITNQRRGLYLENYEYLDFDFRKLDQVGINVWSSQLKGTVLFGDNMLELVEAFSSHTGRMQPLPDWTQSGAIIRAYGGQDEVMQAVDEALAANIPLAGVWVEDWMGRRNTLVGTRLWWNWQVNREIYPDWPEMIQTLREKDIRVMIYFNPYLADVDESQVSYDRILFREAMDASYLVKTLKDDFFLFDAGLFEAALVDLSNPRARNWLKDLMQEQIELGVAGWMADFAEALPYEATLASGADAATFHNKYPLEWAKLNREAIRDAGAEGDVISFHRSGSTQSPRYAPLFWTADQLVTWDQHDGLKTVVPALTSSGLSGWSLNHAEVAGYLSVDLYLSQLNRSKEIFLRWPEISVFTALFRTHSTNRPDTNHQWHSDPETKSVFARYATLFRLLKPYRQHLMDEAATAGHPLVRHPILHYPDDRNVHRLSQQFMFGRDFWVAPVVDQGATSVDAYLPQGRWVHLWSGKVYTSRGESYKVHAPIGKPAVFYRQDSDFGPKLRQDLQAEGLIQSS
jgi:alpha-glucosidase